MSQNEENDLLDIIDIKEEVQDEQIVSYEDIRNDPNLKIQVLSYKDIDGQEMEGSDSEKGTESDESERLDSDFQGSYLTDDEFDDFDDSEETETVENTRNVQLQFTNAPKIEEENFEYFRVKVEDENDDEQIYADSNQIVFDFPESSRKSSTDSMSFTKILSKTQKLVKIQDNSGMAGGSDEKWNQTVIKSTIPENSSHSSTKYLKNPESTATDLNPSDSITIKEEHDIETKIIQIDMLSGQDFEDTQSVPSPGQKLIIDFEDVDTSSKEEPEFDNTKIKQEQEVNFCDVQGSNFLEQQILFDGLQYHGTELSVSPESSKKLEIMSEMVEKSINSSAAGQRTSGRVEFITKSIRIDTEDTVELPETALAEYSIKKFIAKVEKSRGNTVHLYNIPYYICTACSTLLMSQKEFFAHYSKFHAVTDEPFRCWKCNTAFKSWIFLRCHLKTHDETRPFACKFCFYAFKLKDSLDKHLQKVHADRIERISCDICGRSFNNNAEMWKHKGLHTGKGQIIKINDVKSSHAVQRTIGIKCIFCPSQFLKNEDLEIHYRTHKALVWMKCRGCAKSVMVNPQYIIQNIQMREFKCVTCLRGSSSGKAEIDMMMKSSVAEQAPAIKRAIVNPESNKSAPKKKVVLINMNKETRKMSVVCYICGLELGSNIRLFWHMKGHLERMHFKCSVCKEDFKSREDMIQHSKEAHSRNKVTKCDICNKEFHFVDMATHKKVHENQEKESESTLKISEVKSMKPVRLVTFKAKKDVKEENIETVIKPVLVLPRKPIKFVENLATSGSKCLICNKHVLNKDLLSHRLGHDTARRRLLVQNIQNGRRKEDSLTKLRVPNQAAAGSSEQARPRIILKRKTDEPETSGSEKVKVVKIS